MSVAQLVPEPQAPGELTHVQKKTDSFQFVVALLLAAIVFYVFWYWAKNLQTRAEVVSVVVATRNLEPPVVLSSADLRIESVPKAVVPETALPGNKQATAGLTLIHPVARGQVLTVNEFLSNADPGLLGVSVPKGGKGVLLSSTWLAGPMPAVKKGDTVSIVASGGKDTPTNTGFFVQNVIVLDVFSDPSKGVESIFLALDPKVVPSLLLAHASGVSLQVVVDGLGASVPAK